MVKGKRKGKKPPAKKPPTKKPPAKKPPAKKATSTNHHNQYANVVIGYPFNKPRAPRKPAAKKPPAGPDLSQMALLAALGNRQQSVQTPPDFEGAFTRALRTLGPVGGQRLGEGGGTGPLNARDANTRNLLRDAAEERERRQERRPEPEPERRPEPEPEPVQPPPPNTPPPGFTPPPVYATGGRQVDVTPGTHRRRRHRKSPSEPTQIYTPGPRDFSEEKDRNPAPKEEVEPSFFIDDRGDTWSEVNRQLDARFTASATEGEMSEEMPWVDSGDVWAGQDVHKKRRRKAKQEASREVSAIQEASAIQESSREASGEQLITGKGKQEPSEQSDAKTHANQEKVPRMKQDIVDNLTSRSAINADIAQIKAKLRSRVQKLKQSKNPEHSMKQIKNMEHNITLLERRLIDLGEEPTPPRRRRSKKKI
jgi:hypothetical protein